jgi:hypothetical protein
MTLVQIAPKQPKQRESKLKPHPSKGNQKIVTIQPANSAAQIFPTITILLQKKVKAKVGLQRVSHQALDLVSRFKSK